MDLNEMKLGDVLRIAELFGKGRTQSPTCHGMAVVVLDRGFVYVGRTTTDGDWCTIEEARNIRYWGTTCGLGELVRGGPTARTKLDETGIVKAPLRAVIAILPTKEELWKSKS